MYIKWKINLRETGCCSELNSGNNVVAEEPKCALKKYPLWSQNHILETVLSISFHNVNGIALLLFVWNMT